MDLEEKNEAVGSKATDSTATGAVSSNGTSSGAAAIDVVALRESVIDVLKSVYDPEIPVNIYELGMIYEVQVSETADVHVVMTLTSPACPVAETLPGEVENKVQNVDGVASGVVELVWEPSWTPEKMTEAARLQLGMMEPRAIPATIRPPSSRKATPHCHRRRGVARELAPILQYAILRRPVTRPAGTIRRLRE